MTITVKCPVEINQMVWLRNGSSIEHVKVTGFEANAKQQRVRLERQDKERAVWVDTSEYDKEFSANPTVILDHIQNGDVIETLKGETPEGEGDTGDQAGESV